MSFLATYSYNYITNSKRAARKDMYTKVTMNVDDEDVHLINDEGSPSHF